MEALKQLSPNVVSPESLAHYLEQGLMLSQVLAEQKVFMFKISASRLAHLLATSDIANSGRVALTLKMLSGELDDEPR